MSDAANRKPLVAFRLDWDELGALEKAVVDSGTSKSDFIREAIAEKLKRMTDAA